jgi:hypothetical protein
MLSCADTKAEEADKENYEQVSDGLRVTTMTPEA